MKKSILPILLFILALTISCRTSKKNLSYNFDFEKAEHGIPTGWQNFGNNSYKLSLDSTDVKIGKHSAVIEFTSGAPDFKAWSFPIIESFPGHKITLTGYIKTENVTDGYAGLWMRIDPGIAFDNMNKNGVTGTTDWTQYSITLDMNPEKTEQIVVGGLLVGKGKMWLDNLNVTIDGKDIHDLKPLVKKSYPADKDTTFDHGSQINSITLDQNQMDNLKTLGLIWGFLKYYHPHIASGEYNWDYELFRILPKVLKAENMKARDEILVDWIVKLGQFPEGQDTMMVSTETKIKPDLDWITNSNLSDELSTLLLKVKNAERKDDHYYIGLQPMVGNPDFKKEKTYSSMTYPDAGFRLLSLYRYWNIIQYYFPYKNLIEEDWKNVLSEFIPKFIDAKDSTAYMLAVLELIGRVHDTHANIWGVNPVLNDYRGTRYASVEVRFIENKPIVTGFYNDSLGKETDVAIGDIISKINNKTVDEIIAAQLRYTPASNYPTQLRDLARNLLRTNDSIIPIEINRNGTTMLKSLKTYSTKEVNIYSKFQTTQPYFKFITNDIAYINNGSLKREYLPAIWKEIEPTKGLIIDDRNYPSDFPIYDLSSYLMPDSIPFVKFTNGSLKHPGLFTFGKSLKAGNKNENYYKGKVVILVNEISQSSAEFHAMAYRVNPNAIVIGSTTAGADGNVSRFSLPGGFTTMISGIGVYYPDNKETQRIGIIPDMEVKPTIQGIKAGKDEVLEKAVQVINGQ
jgi:C-terminal processing protease CtpA/Prc